MRVVLIHFHLNTGGVTTVVRQQTELLKALGHEVLLLSGSRPPEQWPAPIAVVPGLAYDTPETRAPDGPYETAENILQAINRVWPGRQPDLIHVHNPTLAKNRCLQAVLKRLQQADLPLLCQVHDFAEDGRPEVFFEEPYIADCHYAVVNGRDRRILIGCGLLEKGVHHLPNAIRPLKWYDEAPAPDSGHVLYPVRAIRRKKHWRGDPASAVRLSRDTACHHPAPHQRSGPSRLRHVAAICGPPSSAGHILKPVSTTISNT